MKKFLTLAFMMVILLFVFAACGNSGNDTPTTGNTNQSSQNSQPQNQQGQNEVNNTNESQVQVGNNSGTNVGDIIEFAGFEWRVLDIQNGNAFIMSERVLFNMSYNEPSENLSWEDSMVRQYLNNDFYNSLPETDRNRIVETILINRLELPFDREYEINSAGLSYDPEEDLYDADTTDKIFLLSQEEMDELMVAPNDDFRRAWHIDTSSSTNWWLRTVFYNYHNRESVRRVTASGTSLSRADQSNVGVRPVMWIRL